MWMVAEVVVMGAWRVGQAWREAEDKKQQKRKRKTGDSPLSPIFRSSRASPREPMPVLARCFMSWVHGGSCQALRSRKE